jgi:hypothetical protein
LSVELSKFMFFNAKLPLVAFEGGTTGGVGSASGDGAISVELEVLVLTV